MFNLLRQRNFALLWFGGLISIMGDRVLLVALPYFVYQQTGSTFASAVMVAAELLPRLLLGSIAGVSLLVGGIGIRMEQADRERFDPLEIAVSANESCAQRQCGCGNPEIVLIEPRTPALLTGSRREMRHAVRRSIPRATSTVPPPVVEGSFAASR